MTLVIDTPLTNRLGFHPTETLAELADLDQSTVNNMTAGQKLDLFYLIHSDKFI